MQSRFALFPTLVLALQATNVAIGTASRTAKTIRFISPVRAAKTIQVTEKIAESQGTNAPGPLAWAEIINFKAQRPDHFYIAEGGLTPLSPKMITISDGQTLTTIQGSQRNSVPSATSEWPFPLVGLFNMPGPVSGTLTKWHGQPALVAVRVLGPTGKLFSWFDAKTHLPLQDSMYMTWKGKTSEVMRTVYTGWELNQPIKASLFKTGK